MVTAEEQYFLDDIIKFHKQDDDTANYQSELSEKYDSLIPEEQAVFKMSTVSDSLRQLET